MRPPERKYRTDPSAWRISVETWRLLDRARENPAYWVDIGQWIDSRDPVRAAAGNRVAGQLLQSEDPEAAIGRLEESRRLYVSTAHYWDAREVVELMEPIYRGVLDDTENAELCLELAKDYAAAHNRFDPIPSEVMDDYEG